MKPEIKTVVIEDEDQEATVQLTNGSAILLRESEGEIDLLVRRPGNRDYDAHGSLSVDCGLEQTVNEYVEIIETGDLSKYPPLDNLEPTNDQKIKTGS